MVKSNKTIFTTSSKENEILLENIETARISVCETRNMSISSQSGLQNRNLQAEVANEMLISQMSIPDKVNYFKASNALLQKESMEKEKLKVESYKRRRRVGTESQFIPQYKLENNKLPRFMLLHFGRTRIIWDWLIFLIVAYIAIAIPFNVAFKLNKDIYYSFLLDLSFELFFLIDIAINFRTTFIQPQTGRLITDPKEIAKHYLRGWFSIDCLAALPFELLYFANGSLFQRKRLFWQKKTRKYIGFLTHTGLGMKPDFQSTAGFTVSLLKTGRLLRLFRVGRRVSRYLEYTATLLILMMMSFGLLAHWFACIWYVIGFEELKSGKKIGWLYELGIQMQSPYQNGTIEGGPTTGEKYISALYFVFTSLTTVGFGNIAPNSVGEKIFSVLVLLLGAIIQSAIFGNMTAVIQKLYAARARFHTKATQIKQFVRHHQIDGDLRRRIEDWFISHWSISKGVNTDEMLESFPQELQADICLHLYKGFLTLPCFINASRGCLRLLSVKVKKAYFSPGELVIKEKDAINSIFFVQRGTIEVVQRDYIVAILGTGDLFGEDISNNKPRQKSNGDVRALMYCDILYLTRESIKEVFQNYPDFSDHFSNNIGLAFDLGEKQRKQSVCNSSLGLGSIEEEIEEKKSTTSSEPSNYDEYDESSDNDKDSDKEKVRKSSRRRSSVKIPLWQQKIRRQEMQLHSPTVSLKHYLSKMESQSSCEDIEKIDRSLTQISTCYENSYLDNNSSFLNDVISNIVEDEEMKSVHKMSINNIDLENAHNYSVHSENTVDENLIEEFVNNTTVPFRNISSLSYYNDHNNFISNTNETWNFFENPHLDENNNKKENLKLNKHRKIRNRISSSSLPDIISNSNHINDNITMTNDINKDNNSNNNIGNSSPRVQSTSIGNIDSLEHVYRIKDEQIEGYLDADLGIYSQCSEFGSSSNTTEKLCPETPANAVATSPYPSTFSTPPETTEQKVFLNNFKNKQWQTSTSSINETDVQEMRDGIGKLRKEINDIKGSINNLTELVKTALLNKDNKVS